MIHQAVAYAAPVIHSARDRARSLEALMEMLASFDPESPRVEFTRRFREAAAVLELTHIDLARKFKISRPTAGRWERGESAPHPLGRKAVFDVLMREAKNKRRAIVERFEFHIEPAFADD